MIEIRKTERFGKWIDNLRDIQAKARVLVRIERLASGNAGDVKPVGEGVSEMRIDYGRGYRVYFIQRGRSWSSCWQAATKAASLVILRQQLDSHRTYRS